MVDFSDEYQNKTEKYLGKLMGTDIYEVDMFPFCDGPEEIILGSVFEREDEENYEQ